MKRLLLLSLLLALSISLGTITGCDENKGTDSAGTGNDYASDSAIISDFFGDDDIFGTPFEAFALSFALLDSIPVGAAPKSAGGLKALQDENEQVTITAVISYIYSGGWHIFEFEATVVDLIAYDTIDVVGIDSVQLLDDGQPVQYITPETQMDELRARTHADLDDRSGESHGDMHHAVSFAMDTPVITINGTVHDTLSASSQDEGGSCEVSLTLDQTITNLQMYVGISEGGDCPNSGHVSMTASLDMTCVGLDDGPTSLSISGTWTITATVNDNNTVTITYTDGTTTWATTETCDGGSGSSSFLWM